MSLLEFPEMEAVPNEMNFALPSELRSAQARQIRVSPVAGSQFTITSSTQMLHFDLPCGQHGDYLDPTTIYARYKVNYLKPATYTAGTDYGRLIGSSYSFFNYQRVLGNGGTNIEEIPEVGVLASALYNMQLNDSDKRGLSSAFGFDYSITAPDYASSTTGHKIGYTDSTATIDGWSHEYTCPIIGILGSGTNKCIPVGKLLSLALELQLDVPANIIMNLTGQSIISYTISEIELVANYVRLSSETQRIIDSANPSVIHIRSQSYKEGGGTLTGGSNGTNEIPVNIRVNSLKSLYMFCSPANAAEGKFASVNPNLGSGSAFLISGALLPARGLDPSTRTADCFTSLQQAQGALQYASYNGCISKNGYYVSSMPSGLCQAYNPTKANSQSSPNQFYFGVDTEVLARKDTLLSGISTYQSGIFFRANITTALAAVSHALYFFGFYDLVLEIDCNARTMTAKL